MMPVYVARVVHDLPDLRQVEFDIPGGLGVVTLLVEVRPVEASPYVCVCRSLGYSDVNELFTWPTERMALAVASGYGHYFAVEAPLLRTEIPVFPVRQALRHDSGIAVLVGFDRVCGLDGEGIQWVSSAVASDWIDEVQLQGDELLGRGNIPETGGHEHFRLSVMDGSRIA